MPTDSEVYISPAVTQGLTAAWKSVQLTDASRDVPGQFLISGLNMLFDNVVTAASVDWYLAEDASATRPLCVQSNSAMQTGKAAGDRQVDVSILRRRHHSVTDQSSRTLYLIIKTNAGTCDMKASGARCVIEVG